MAVTLVQFSKMIRGLPKYLEKNADKYQVPALTQHQSNVDARVFGEGIASDGLPIDSKVKAKSKDQDSGAYSSTHGEKRSNEGRQIDYIDLELEGDFRRSLITGTGPNGFAYGFIDEEFAEIGEAHEEYRDKDIFAATDDEIDDVIRVVNKRINGLLKIYFGR